MHILVTRALPHCSLACKTTDSAMFFSSSVVRRSAIVSSASLPHATRAVAPLLSEARGLRREHTTPIAAAMAEHEAGKNSEPEKKVIEEEHAKGLNDAGGSQQLGKLAADIMPQILNLYSLKATAHDYEMYTSNATFEDPLMKAKGVKQIKSAFYSMPKIFSEGKFGEYSVNETETKPGSGEIRIDNMQHYKVWGKAIDMRSLIKLQVEDGKVVRHEDLWDKKPLWDRNTIRVPLVGRAIEGWRRLNMLVTHTLMGFGKDPKN